MKTLVFLLAIFPVIVLVNVVYLWGVYNVGLFHNFWPSNVQISKAIVFTVMMTVVIKIFKNFKHIFRLSDSNVFVSHLQPILEEVIKFAFISFIAYQDGTGFVFTVWQFIIMAAIYSSFHLVEFILDFCPFIYQRKYSRFLSLHSEFYNMGNTNSEEFKHDATDQIMKHFPIDNYYSDTLGDVLPKRISVSQLDAPNNNIKGQRSLPVITSQPQQQGSLNKYQSCYNLVDKIYSVSPKNTYHLISASADAIKIDDIDGDQEVHGPMEYYDDPNNTGEPPGSSLDADDPLFVATETNSLHDSSSRRQSSHSLHTDYGGGGGGNFKYKLPNGSKLKFGGGGGFNYSHHSHSHRSKNSCSDTSSTTLIPSSPTHQRSKWFSWLWPSRQQSNENNVIKKKLSTYSLHKGEEEESIKSFTSLSPTAKPRYGSIDLEAQTHNNLEIPIEFTKSEFNNYITLCLDLDRFKIKYDPVFDIFGKKIIKEMTFFEVMLYYFNEFNWEFNTLLIFSINYLTDNSYQYYWPIFILKLFNINFLNNLALNLKTKLGLKLMINVFFFSVLILFYIL